MLIEESNYIMRCVVGSTAHGVALPGRDDRDEMAVYVEPPAHVTGHRRPIDSRCTRTAGEGERSTADDTDVMAYSLRHWTDLALHGNPSILVGLFAAPFLDSEEWRQVQDTRDLILSRRAHPRFLGYLHGQRERLLGSGKSSRMPKRTELIEAHGYDTKYASHALRLALQGIELWRTGGLSLPMERRDREDVLTIKTGSVDFADAMRMIDSADDRLRRVTDEPTPLRAEPDYAAVDRLLHSIHMAVWSRMGGGA